MLEKLRLVEERYMEMAERAGQRGSRRGGRGIRAMNALHLIWIIPVCIFAGILMAALLSANGRK